MKPGAPTRFLFLATLFSITFEKLHWNVAGAVSIADVLALAFLAAFAAEGRWRLPRTALVVLGFLAAFLLVYLLGYFNLATSEAVSQFDKGLIKFIIHFAFLFAGIAYLARRGERFYWRAFGWFVAGMTFNAAYGLLQLLAAQAGLNLDSYVLSPVTGGASAINLYGVVGGTQAIYRPNALTGDPNHLGIMLDIPLLVLMPVYLRLERGHPWRRRLVWAIGFLLVMEVATLSRSGILGLLVGLAVLASPYRRKLRSREFLLLLGSVLAVLGVIVLARLSFFEKVISTRVETGGSSTSAHFGVYSFIPKILHLHPLFGLGLNNFSVYYQQITGKTNFGPHSFYVSLIVESGVVGTALFGVFLWFLFRRLRRARELGRALTVAHDPLGRRVRPLAWGLTAALAATMAANLFYLTMSFYYFYAFALLALAVPIVFGRRSGVRLR